MPAKKITKKATIKNSSPEKAEKKVAVKKTTTKKSAAEKVTITSKAPATNAAKKPAAKKSTTTIVANYDVGMGNNLLIRGDAPGLSWDTGTIMENPDPETWKWTTSKAKSGFEIKFLINDTTWSQGENEVIKPGTTAGFAPSF
jgi:hypothetical protein